VDTALLEETEMGSKNITDLRCFKPMVHNICAPLACHEPQYIKMIKYEMYASEVGVAR